MNTILVEAGKRGGSTHKHKWTDEERDIVRRDYKGRNQSAHQIADRLTHMTGDEITFCAVKGQAAKMGILQNKSPRWTDKEIDILSEMITRYSPMTIAHKLHRSLNAVQLQDYPWLQFYSALYTAITVNSYGRRRLTIRALSIKMPWAYLIARGVKDIENRTWKTNFRGRVYIHAGKRFDNTALSHHHLIRLKEDGGLIDMDSAGAIVWLNLVWQYSAIIGEVDIVDCVTKSSSPWFEGPYGFVLANPVKYDKWIPCLGRQRFFEPGIGGMRV